MLETGKSSCRGRPTSRCYERLLLFSLAVFLSSFCCSLVKFELLRLIQDVPDKSDLSGTSHPHVYRENVPSTFHSRIYGVRSGGRHLVVASQQQQQQQQQHGGKQQRGKDWWKAPLVMSTVAGMSTALGAAIVFLFPRQKKNKVAKQSSSLSPSWDMDHINDSVGLDEDTAVVVSPNVLCFSLSLAGSVMVTISFISLLPQCFLTEDGHFLPIAALTTRLVSLVLGCALYKLLSRAFPEPDDVLWNNHHGSTEMAASATELGRLNGDTLPKTSCSVVSPGEIEMHQTDSSCSGISIETHNRSAGIFRPTVTRRSKSTSSSRDDTVASAEEQERLLSPTAASLSMQRSCSGEDTKDICNSPGGDIIRSRSNGSGGGGKEFSSDEPKGVQARRGSPSKPPEGMPSSYKRNKGFFQWSFQGSDLQTSEQRKSWRIAMLLFVALLVHNFPEGLAVAASTAQSRQLGLTVTVGIMIHNIPEGIAIAVPCLRARPQEPWLAFVLATLSGLAEPLGAAATVALIELFGFAPDDRPVGGDMKGTNDERVWALGLEDVLAFVAGVMIMVAVCELFPEARRHLKNQCDTTSDSANTANSEEEQPLTKETEPSASMSAFAGGLVSGFVVMFITEHYLPE